MVGNMEHSNRHRAEAWLATLSEAIEKRNFPSVAAMMHPDGYWRDLLTFGWDFRTLHGVAHVESWLRETSGSNSPRNFSLEEDPSIGSLGEHRETLEFFFRFDTPLALGRGFARLVADANSAETLKAFTILTAMKELKAFPEAVGRNRP